MNMTRCPYGDISIKYEAFADFPDQVWTTAQLSMSSMKLLLLSRHSKNGDQKRHAKGLQAA